MQKNRERSRMRKRITDNQPENLCIKSESALEFSFGVRVQTKMKKYGALKACVC